MKHCVMCGGPAQQSSDNEEGYYEALAESYGLSPEIIQLALEDWDPHEYFKFSDYLESLRKEVGL
jgi:hypothetical protein